MHAKHHSLCPKDLSTSECLEWEAKGECKTKEKYMSENCGESCAVDKGGPNCPAWAKAGECGKNPEYMYKECAKSCCIVGGPTGKKTKEENPVVAVGLESKIALTHPDPTLPGCNCGWGKKPTPQEVVMGVATGYSWGQIRNFVVSLRNTGYTGDIALGMNPTNQAEHMKKELTKYCVKALAVTYNMTYLPDMPIASRRFLLYRHWLQELGYQDQARVLVVDVRDTIFQRQPFADFNEYSSNGKDLLLFADNHPLSKDGGADFHTYLLHGTCFPKVWVDVLANYCKCGCRLHSPFSHSLLSIISYKGRGQANRCGRGDAKWARCSDALLRIDNRHEEEDA
jgi:hypothetical protein